MVDAVKNNLEAIYDACKKYHVESLYLFGSGARGTDFNESSDVDFLVQFNYRDEINDNNIMERVGNIEILKVALENIIKREVDLIQEKNIKNKFLKYFINKDKKMVYGLS